MSGALVPMLTLGIPGSGLTAVLLAAFTLHNIRPGPMLMAEQPDLVWGLIASMFIGNIMLLILNLPLAPLFASLLRIPYAYLAPGILIMALVGAYASNLQLFTVAVTLVFGVLGYLMIKADLPRSPLILALVLAPIMETLAAPVADPLARQPVDLRHAAGGGGAAAGSAGDARLASVAMAERTPPGRGGHMTEMLSPNEARALASEVLCRSNTAEAHARIVAEALVAADLDGIASHGLSRLPAYADQAKSGKVDGLAEPVVTRPAAAVVRVDARQGFAFPAIRAGLAAALDALQGAGIVAIAVANSHHCGVAGHHVEWLAERGAVGLFFANTPAAMAPWGGTRASFGTNPIAFAAPRRGAPPLVVDLSLSKVARGRIMVAKQKREAIPPDWALDSQGRPTTDPAAALDGTMLPLGDAKGAALALMVEVLAATLTGSHHAFEATSFFEFARGSPPRRAVDIGDQSGALRRPRLRGPPRGAHRAHPRPAGNEAARGAAVG